MSYGYSASLKRISVHKAFVFGFVADCLLALNSYINGLSVVLTFGHFC